MPPNIYVYKCVVDDGTAPCIDRGLLSMTVCKPKIRTSANPRHSRCNKKTSKFPLLTLNPQPSTVRWPKIPSRNPYTVWYKSSRKT
jgi:hypothetical protein